MEDNEIIELYFARSEDAVAETDKKYGAYCRRISSNILADKRDVEECVSDTYLKTWNSIPPERPALLSAFLARIIRNISINKYRYLSAEKRGGGLLTVILSELGECIPSRSGVEKDIESARITEVIDGFLRSLSDEKRNIFILRYWYSEPISEISKIFRISESKAASVLHRVRKALKKRLEEEGISL
ncbi:MAG: RNA polymerase sigma factor [Clostridia bacterium]|nr:RNA polymerase sigma factor [Clostridia bacterium]